MGANDVDIKFNANTEAAQKEIEKLRAQVNGLGDANDKLKNKTKSYGKEGANSFMDVGKGVNNMVANVARGAVALGALKKLLDTIGKQYEKIRQQEDSANTTIDKSITTIQMQGGAKFAGKGARGQIADAITSTAQAKGLSIEAVTQGFAAATGAGASIEDLRSGKYNADLELARATGGESQAITELMNAQLLKSNQKNTAENRKKLAAKNLSAFGTDIGEANNFQAKLPKGVSTDQGMEIYNQLKVGFAGKGTSASAEFKKYTDTGGKGFNALLKDRGISQSAIDAGVKDRNATADEGFSAISNIASTDIEASLNKERAKNIEFNRNKNRKTEELIKLENENKNQALGAEGDTIEIVKSLVGTVPGQTEQSKQSLGENISNFSLLRSVAMPYILERIHRSLGASETKTQIDAGSKQINVNDSKGGKK